MERQKNPLGKSMRFTIFEGIAGLYDELRQGGDSANASFFGGNITRNRRESLVTVLFCCGLITIGIFVAVES